MARCPGVLKNTHDFYRKMLSPGVNLDPLIARYQSELVATLDNPSTFPVDGEPVDLYNWARYTITDTVTNAAMGRCFLAQNEGITAAIWDFDETMVNMMYGLPGFLLGRGPAARDLLQAEIEKYFASDVPAADRMPINFERKALLEEHGFSPAGVAQQVLSVFWA